MEDAVRKIQKALSLASNNSNAEESHAAMLLAQRLMAKHGLTTADVSVAEPASKEVKQMNIRADRIEWWQRKLIQIIATNFRCEGFFARGVRISFLGLKEDAQIAAEVFGFADSAIRYNASKYLRESGQSGFGRKFSLAVKNDYISGFLRGLKDKFEEQVKNECLALVLVKDDAVIAAVEKKKIKIVHPPTRSTAKDEDAANQGYRDGKSFSNPSGRMIEGV